MMVRDEELWDLLIEADMTQTPWRMVSGVALSLMAK